MQNESDKRGKRPPRKRGGKGRPHGKKGGSPNARHTNTDTSSKVGQKQQVKTELEGTITTNTKGVGIFWREDEKGIVRVEREFLNTALSGDRVRIRLLPRRQNEDIPRAEVVEILVRNKLEYVGVVKKSGNIYSLQAQDTRMFRDIIIPPEHLNGARPGKKALALIHVESWDNPRRDPEGEILKVLGDPGNNDVEMEAIVLDKGFRTDFPQEIEDEAQKIKENAAEHFEEERGNRRDMTDATTFTIDPAEAKDFDDALSYRVLPSGNIEVGIHIADVTFYVTPDSKIDQEARRRATSIYLVDRTIPMLPEVLSNDLCSLNPNEDKLAFSAVFTFAPDAMEHNDPRPLDRWFGRTIIRSDHRFTYETAQEVLDTGEGPHREALTYLHKVGNRLRQHRMEEGAVAFESNEVKFELDDEGRPIRVYSKPVLETNHLIEEYMLLANRNVAEHVHKLLKEKDTQLFIYRVHDRPDNEKIQDLISFLDGLGYDLSAISHGTIESHEINKLLEQAAGEAEEHLVQTATIRAMAKAIYSTKNIGHFGLAFEHYTHFTSPIRRYPDMMVHRLLDHYLSGEDMPKTAVSEYRDMAAYSSEMEQIASDAERSSIRYKQAEYFSTRIGEEAQGVISSITDWGMFVEEKETRATGLIRLSEMGDDYYVYDSENYRLVGESTGKTFQIGDEVTIKIKEVDLEQRQIGYELVQ